MTKNLEQRVLDLEDDMRDQITATQQLTKAVNELTDVLSQGKGAVKLFMYLVMTISAVATAATWIIQHISLKVGP